MSDSFPLLNGPFLSSTTLDISSWELRNSSTAVAVVLSILTALSSIRHLRINTSKGHSRLLAVLPSSISTLALSARNGIGGSEA